MNVYLFTPGDINGIGPEIVLKAFDKIEFFQNEALCFICPSNVLDYYRSESSLKINFNKIESLDRLNGLQSGLYHYDIGKSEIKLGEPTFASGRIAYESIVLSVEALKKNLAVAVITSPISKKALQLAGIKFPGHTEMLAELSRVKNFAMTFVSKKFNCGLVTIHESIANVPKLISKESLIKKIETMIDSMIIDFGIKKPSTAILGLNPHAGEDGVIGGEEREIILPAINASKYSELIDGPFPADAFFARRNFEHYDLVIGMYHDQILIPFKLLNANAGVNYTAGLPFIRTSPDHGTAFDIAGKNVADPGSIIESFEVARRIAENRKKYKND